MASTCELGIRGLQDAVEAASSDQGKARLASVLKGRVSEAWRSPYANIFLEKCVQNLPAAYLGNENAT